MFLTRATELADRMMFAFEKSQHGLPCAQARGHHNNSSRHDDMSCSRGHVAQVSLRSPHACSWPAWAGTAAILAEFGTIQLEFKYLAHHTGQQKCAARTRAQPALSRCAAVARARSCAGGRCTWRQLLLR